MTGKISEKVLKKNMELFHIVSCMRENRCASKSNKEDRNKKSLELG